MPLLCYQRVRALSLTDLPLAYSWGPLNDENWRQPHAHEYLPRTRRIRAGDIVEEREGRIQSAERAVPTH
jgi:hypothetical protein